MHHHIMVNICRMEGENSDFQIFNATSQATESHTDNTEGEK